MADASYPDDLKYHPEHDWARIEGDVATFGITWYAQDQLGEVVFVDPPEVGKTVAKDEPYAEIESVKAVSDVVAPLSGEWIHQAVLAIRAEIPLATLRDTIAQFPTFSEGFGAALRALPDEAIDLSCDHTAHPHIAEPVMS